MILILVGPDVMNNRIADWNQGHYGYLPKELVQNFLEWLSSRDTKGQLLTIRVSTGDVINALGEWIEREEYPASAFVVLTTEGTHMFDSKGVLSQGTPWPYGIFNYS
jgi:hypothetical protein